MLKLFPSVCASQILWEFVKNCWSALAETAATKPSRMHTWGVWEQNYLNGCNLSVIFHEI